LEVDDMKLKPNYPHADPKQYIAFMNAGQEGIALEFAQRLAAFFKAKSKIGYISSGYRNVARQKVLYEQNCKDHPPAGDGYVARPGNSWHNGRCAIDLDDRGFWKKYMESGDMKRTIKRQELYKYGLCLSLNHVDAHTVFEWWHIQPIETIGYTGDRTKFLDPDDRISESGEITIKDFQKAMGLRDDGIVGPLTIAKAKEVQEVINMILRGGKAI
jgi:peptidoglycan hydrolase-like protein with peptidoglycan-binding domain